MLILNSQMMVHSFRQITNLEAIYELVQLRGLLSQVTLSDGTEDTISWKRNSFAIYSAKSAYRFQFI